MILAAVGEDVGGGRERNARPRVEHLEGQGAVRREAPKRGRKNARSWPVDFVKKQCCRGQYRYGVVGTFDFDRRLPPMASPKIQCMQLIESYD